MTEDRLWRAKGKDVGKCKKSGHVYATLVILILFVGAAAHVHTNTKFEDLNNKFENLGNEVAQLQNENQLLLIQQSKLHAQFILLSRFNISPDPDIVDRLKPKTLQKIITAERNLSTWGPTFTYDYYPPALAPDSDDKWAPGELEAKTVPEMEKKGKWILVRNPEGSPSFWLMARLAGDEIEIYNAHHIILRGHDTKHGPEESGHELYAGLHLIYLNQDDQRKTITIKDLAVQAQAIYGWHPEHTRIILNVLRDEVKLPVITPGRFVLGQQIW